MTWKEDVNLAKFYLQPSRSQTWLSQILGCAGAFLIHRWETIELHLQVSGDVFVAWFHWPNSWHPDHLVSLGTPWFSMVFGYHIFSQKPNPVLTRMAWCNPVFLSEVLRDLQWDHFWPVEPCIRPQQAGRWSANQRASSHGYLCERLDSPWAEHWAPVISLWWYDPLAGSSSPPMVPRCAKLCQVLRKSPPVAIRRSWRRMWPRWRPCWRMATRAGPCPRRSWTPPVPGRGRSAERVEKWG